MLSTSGVTKTLKGSNFTIQSTAKFTALVAILAILVDAALGHGLTWENDPYWTYWVTKTFLIATIFGLGTLWFGIGVKKGAVIAAVHTLVLTLYYWALSPIGLPSSPEWLDLQHTWITGVPIHFGVIYLGYLLALWIWRTTSTIKEQAFIEPKNFRVRVLILSLLIVLVAGSASSLALGHFAGITWFVVRFLITVPFLILWQVLVGTNKYSPAIGGVILALIWATYAQFLGPVGLPDIHNLRILSQAAPPSPAQWLNYNQLWLISFPIYLVTMVAFLLLSAHRMNRKRLAIPFIATLVVITAVTLAVTAVPKEPASNTAQIEANGKTFVETGDYYSNNLIQSTGFISVFAKDSGSSRVSPLPPHDEVNISATIASGSHVYQVTASHPMVDDPMGQFTTWWGAGFNVNHHGRSGIGTNKLPSITSKLAVFAMGDIMMDGKVVAANVPVHAMTAERGLANNAHLELDVGDARASAIPGIPSGHLRALWSNYSGPITDSSLAHYLGGASVLAFFLLAMLYINSKKRS